MNKRCTNSSCRRTFSTLNADVKCPYCGKPYPQMNSKRKHTVPVSIMLHIKTGKGCQYLNVQFDELLRLDLNGEKKTRAFINQIKAQGYHANHKRP